MKRRGKLTYKLKRNHIVLKKTFGIVLAVAGAVIVIHAVPAVIWYVILGLLLTTMVIYLVL